MRRMSIIRMKIRIDSNFIIPGLEGVNEIDLNHTHVDLRIVLEELSLRSSGRVKFIRPLKDFVDHMDFFIEINGLPNPGSKEGLETSLNEGDLVTIKLSPLGGG
jgi:hypothetical protein